MKEIISQRKKTTYIFVLVACVFSILASTSTTRIPMLRFIGIPIYIVLISLSIFCIFLLLSPHGAIERDGDSIIIRRGIRKTIVNKKDILEAFPTPHPSKPNQIQKNAVSFKITVNGKEQILVCGDVVDVDTTVEKLTAIISET
jgi:hypothetical protein